MVEPGIGTGEPGAAAEPLNRVTADVSAMIGSAEAEVLFAGMAPGFVGLSASESCAYRQSRFSRDLRCP